MRIQPVVALAALLSTLCEVKEGPESSFYLPFMNVMNLDEFQAIIGTMIKMGLCTNSGHYLSFVQPVPGSDGEKILNTVLEIEKASGRTLASATR